MQQNADNRSNAIKPVVSLSERSTPRNVKLCPKCNAKSLNSAAACSCGHVFLINEKDDVIKCSVCGTLNQKTQCFCTYCTYNLHIAHPGVHIEPDPTAQQGHSNTKSNGDNKTELVFTFGCMQCGKNLRIQLADKVASYRCPKCLLEFSVSIANQKPLVYVVIPDIRKYTYKNTPKAKLPKEVMIALKSLDLEGYQNFDEVKRAYRELIKQYHPDKVSGLGIEIKKLAEAKTKEINTAYQIIESFHLASSEQ